MCNQGYKSVRLFLRSRHPLGDGVLGWEKKKGEEEEKGKEEGGREEKERVRGRRKRKKMGGGEIPPVLWLYVQALAPENCKSTFGVDPSHNKEEDTINHTQTDKRIQERIQVVLKGNKKMNQKKNKKWGLFANKNQICRNQITFFLFCFVLGVFQLFSSFFL